MWSVLLAGLVTPAAAHPAADEALAAELAGGAAGEPEVWLRRARALAAEGRTGDGLAALQRARALGADPAEVALARGVLLAASDPGRAELELDAALAGRPGHAGALATRARLRAARGDAEGAAADLLALGDRAGPDDRLLAARLLRDLGRPAEALEVLDGGPPAPALVEAAVALELALGRPDAALGRLDALPEAPWTWALRDRVAGGTP